MSDKHPIVDVRMPSGISYLGVMLGGIVLVHPSPTAEKFTQPYEAAIMHKLAQVGKAQLTEFRAWARTKGTQFFIMQLGPDWQGRLLLHLGENDTVIAVLCY